MMKLDNFTLPHQVATPWGEWTGAFHVGAQGVESIELDHGAIVILIAKEQKGRWRMLFCGGGYGFASAGLACSVCAEEFATPAELGAHKRSHKPNHKGLE